MSANTTEPTQPVTRKPSQKKGRRKDAKVKKAAAAPSMPPVIAAHGHELRYARGDVVVEQAADPDSPNRVISRVRTVPNYSRLFKLGTLDEYQHEACDRYLVWHEALNGARWIDGEIVVRGATAFWDRVPASERQLKAVESIREIEAVLGAQGTLYMRLFVLENMLVSAMAVRFGFIPHKMMGRIEMLLDQMVEVWGLKRVVAGPPSRIR